MSNVVNFPIDKKDQDTEDEYVFSCLCGNDTFCLSSSYVICIECSQEFNYEDIFNAHP